MYPYGALKEQEMPPMLISLGIDRMTVQQRIELVQAIWDSIAADTEATPLSEAHIQEIDRRLAAHNANPQASIPWDQIEAEALARIGK
jgi:putative addiction module component (TIGR02574 family)